MAARRKVDLEGRCRSCGRTAGLQAAHTISRSRDKRDGPHPIHVDPELVIPLCPRCHSLYDAHQISILERGKP